MKTNWDSIFANLDTHCSRLEKISDSHELRLLTCKRLLSEAEQREMTLGCNSFHPSDILNEALRLNDWNGLEQPAHLSRLHYSFIFDSVIYV